MQNQRLSLDHNYGCRNVPGDYPKEQNRDKAVLSDDAK